MRDLQIGQLVRLLRRRRGWRQIDLAVRAKVHRSTVSLVERGELERITLGTLRAILEALEVRLDMRPIWRGPELDRLLDADHADLSAAWKLRLERWGWVVWVEASFSRYGERGRIDLLAWQPRLGILLVVEVKTDLADVQQLLGALDVKVRNAPDVAAGLGLGRPVRVVPVIVFKENRTVRRRVTRLDPLFGRFGVRGRAATGWLHTPNGGVGGLLIFSDLTNAAVSRGSRGGPRRVRIPNGRARPSSAASSVAAVPPGRSRSSASD